MTNKPHPSHDIEWRDSSHYDDKRYYPKELEIH